MQRPSPTPFPPPRMTSGAWPPPAWAGVSRGCAAAGGAAVGILCTVGARWPGAAPVASAEPGGLGLVGLRPVAGRALGGMASQPDRWVRATAEAPLRGFSDQLK